MTLAALRPLIPAGVRRILWRAGRRGPQWNEAQRPLRACPNDVDPWRDAMSLARMPREAGAERLTSLIGGLPRELASAIPSQTGASDLVALLPKGRTPSVRISDSALGATGSRQTPMLIERPRPDDAHRLCDSVLFSPGPEIGANLLELRAADARAWPLRFESSAAALAWRMRILRGPPTARKAAGGRQRQAQSQLHHLPTCPECPLIVNVARLSGAVDERGVFHPGAHALRATEHLENHVPKLDAEVLANQHAATCLRDRLGPEHVLDIKAWSTPETRSRHTMVCRP
jgi:hypothetical protein